MALINPEYAEQIEKHASFFNCDNIERVIFTKNCTEALNLAIMGTLKKGMQSSL